MTKNDRPNLAPATEGRSLLEQLQNKCWHLHTYLVCIAILNIKKMKLRI